MLWDGSTLYVTHPSPPKKMLRFEGKTDQIILQFIYNKYVFMNKYIIKVEQNLRFNRKSGNLLFTWYKKPYFKVIAGGIGTEIDQQNKGKRSEIDFGI